AQDRTLLWLERARARGGRGMAVLADGRPWTDVRASQPFPQLCAREGGVWNQPLHQRSESSLWRDEQAARTSGISRRTLFDRRHRLRRMDEGLEEDGSGDQRL